MKDKKGLTLIEILVASAVLGVILVVLYSILIRSHYTYASATRLASLQDRGRVAIDRMATEIRQSDPSKLSITTVNGNSAVTFEYITGISSGTPVWSSSTSYQWESGPVGGRLVRIQGSDKLTITDNVATNGLSISLTGTQVKITLTLEDKDESGKTLTAPHETTINLRNKQ